MMSSQERFATDLVDRIHRARRTADAATELERAVLWWGMGIAVLCGYRDRCAPEQIWTSVLAFRVAAANLIAAEKEGTER